LIKELIGILGILVILIEIYRYLRNYWLRRLLVKRKKEKRILKPAVLRPKSEKDCRFCREEKDKQTVAKCEPPESWQLRKGRGGPKKMIQTEGFFCPNKSCEYYSITEEGIHALVGYVQLDELWANIKAGSQDIWLWVVTDVKTKIVPVLQFGGRKQDMAFSVVHELKRRLAVGASHVYPGTHGALGVVEKLLSLCSTT
jgi:hypothetical protein